MKYNIVTKSVSFFLIIIIVCLLCGCNNSDDNINENNLSSSSMPDFQYMFKLLGAQAPTQKSNDGYYNLVSNNIIYTDKNTLDSTPLCNKTDCLHTGDYPDCNAKIKDRELSSDNFQIYRDNLYYLAFDTNEKKEQKNYLKRISLDGTEKNTELTLSNKFIVDWFLYDGYFYYQTSMNVGDNNDINMSSNFYRINLTDKKEEVFADFSKISGVYGAEGTFRNVYNGYMYVTLCGYKNEGDYNKIINGETADGNLDTVREIYRYSLSDGSYKLIKPYDNEYEFVGFFKDKLLGYVDDSDSGDRDVCVSELDGSNPEKIVSYKFGSEVFCDNSYVYIYSFSFLSDDSDEPKTIKVYDENGKLISEKRVPDEITNDLLMSNFYDDYIWFIKNESNAEKLCCIDKSQLFTQDDSPLTYNEVYTYE